MNQEDQQIEQYWPSWSEDMDQHSNIWKMGRALNKEIIGQMGREHFIHE